MQSQGKNERLKGRNKYDAVGLMPPSLLGHIQDHGHIGCASGHARTAVPRQLDVRNLALSGSPRALLREGSSAIRRSARRTTSSTSGFPCSVR